STRQRRVLVLSPRRTSHGTMTIAEIAKTNPLRASRAVVLRLGEGPRMARFRASRMQKQTHFADREQCNGPEARRRTSNGTFPRLENAKTNPLRRSRAVVLRLSEGPRIALCGVCKVRKQTHLMLGRITQTNPPNGKAHLIKMSKQSH